MYHVYNPILRYDNKNDYCTDVTKFPNTRFASEFGYQSYPSFNAIRNISNGQVSKKTNKLKSWSVTAGTHMHTYI